MDSNTELVFPIVNLNGADRESLIEQNMDACTAARAAFAAALKAAPHGRDFQISPAGDYEKAAQAHIARCEKLRDITEDFEAIAIHLAGGR